MATQSQTEDGTDDNDYIMMGYKMFCLPCHKTITPVMMEHWDAPECPLCQSIDLE
jgi:Zn finger protein HypA/HybF involved in hydrogenase expression